MRDFQMPRDEISQFIDYGWIVRIASARTEEIARLLENTFDRGSRLSVTRRNPSKMSFRAHKCSAITPRPSRVSLLFNIGLKNIANGFATRCSFIHEK